MKKFGKILGGIILGIVLILLAAVAILPSGSDRDFEHNQWKTVHIYRRFDNDPDL
mgnify:CR=1 FL=1